MAFKRDFLPHMSTSLISCQCANILSQPPNQGIANKKELNNIHRNLLGTRGLQELNQELLTLPGLFNQPRLLAPMTLAFFKKESLASGKYAKTRIAAQALRDREASYLIWYKTVQYILCLFMAHIPQPAKLILSLSSPSVLVGHSVGLARRK